MKSRNNHGGNIYQDGLGKEVMDFSSNINPQKLPQVIYGALPAMLEKAKAYPDIEYRDLKKSIAEYLNSIIKRETITMDMVIAGNGATELLEKAIGLYRRVIITIPSFYEYERSVEKAGAEAIFIDRYKGNFLLDGNDLRLYPSDIYTRIQLEIDDKICDAVVLCNPNNPDGSRLDIDKIEDLIRNNPKVMFIIDETFGEYLDMKDMVLNIFEKYRNVIVIKALTKFFGLPGTRLGYSVSINEELNERIYSSLPVWNVNTFSSEIAMLMFKEKDYISSSILENQKNREYLLKKMNNIPLFERVYSSSSDFIMVKSDHSLELERYLKTKGILIRNLGNMRGLDSRYIRLAVKTKVFTDRLEKEIMNFYKISQ